MDGWFLPLSGGKNILFPWSTTILFKVFPQWDYLITGRLPSVGAGIFTLIATYKTAKLMFSSKVAILASFLYVLLPLALFYERMALYDSFLSATTSWAIYFCFKSAKNLELKDFVCWGVAVGFAHLAKATAIIYSVLLPVAFIILIPNFSRVWGKALLLIAISFGISQLIANSIIISSGYIEYLYKALDHTPGAESIISNPLSLFWNNLLLTFDWLNFYVTMPLVLVSFTGIFLLLLNKERFRTGLYLLAITAVPVCVMAFFGREYFPRYLTIIGPGLTIAAAYFLTRLPRKVLLMTLPLVFYSMTNFMVLALTEPDKLPLPEVDRWQYVVGFPSGYGLEEVFSYIKMQKGDENKITIVTEGSYSHYPNAFHLEFWDEPTIKILERWPLDIIDNELILANKESDLYIILRDNYIVNEFDKFNSLPVEVLFTVAKPGGRDKIYVTKLINNGE